MEAMGGGRWAGVTLRGKAALLLSTTTLGACHCHRSSSRHRRNRTRTRTRNRRRAGVVVRDSPLPSAAHTHCGSRGRRHCCIAAHTETHTRARSSGGETSCFSHRGAARCAPPTPTRDSLRSFIKRVPGVAGIRHANGRPGGGLVCTRAREAAGGGVGTAD